jgi:glycosidase
VLGGEDSEGLTNAVLSVKKMTALQRKRAIKMLKLAYAIVSTVPGIPCIYYGDEAGMEGYRDPFNRLPYPWGREEYELVDFYKKVGKIRTKEPLFRWVLISDRVNRLEISSSENTWLKSLQRINLHQRSNFNMSISRVLNSMVIVLLCSCDRRNRACAGAGATTVSAVF